LRAPPRIELVELSTLKPHEHLRPARLHQVYYSIRRTRTLYKPLIADAQTLLLIDGHHRLKSLALLGVRRAPVLLVDYERDIRSVRVRTPLFSLKPEYTSLTGAGERMRLLDRLVRLPLLPAKSTIHETWAKRVVLRYRL